MSHSQEPRLWKPFYPSQENLPGHSCFLSCPALVPTGLGAPLFEGKPHSCFFLTAVRLSPREEAFSGQPSPFQERAPELQDPAHLTQRSYLAPAFSTSPRLETAPKRVELSILPA